MTIDKKGGLHVCIEVADEIRAIVSRAIQANGHVPPERVQLIRDFARKDVEVHVRDIYNVLPRPAVQKKSSL